MRMKRVGDQTLIFPSHPHIMSAWTVVGPEEAVGPMAEHFDTLLDDAYYGESTAERAEMKYLSRAIDGALSQGRLLTQDIDLFVGGDLLNQIVSATFNARNVQIPYLGLYNACASLGEAFCVSAMAVDGGYAEKVMLGVSSHYLTAERQYRYPIELNIQRKPTNQTTVSGAGVAILSTTGQFPYITMGTVGRVVDSGEKDTNDMGCAMAPAAADTLSQHFKDTGCTPGDYDLIVTGDLASYGSELMKRMLRDDSGLSLGNKHIDCGCEIFGCTGSDAGGSGCACSATVILGYVLKQMQQSRWKKVLCVPTGALHSTTTSQQGETIPCIAHAIALEA